MQMNRNDKSSVIIKDKLDENQISEKILLAQEKINSNANVMKKFKNDLEPHSSREFQKALKIITLQYQCLMKYDVSLEVRVRLRKSIASSLISSGLVDIFVPILHQLFDNIPDLSGTVEVDESLYDSIKKIMFVYFNYSDASDIFGNEVCKKDKLLVRYHQLLTSTHQAVTDNSITKNFTEIVRTIIATLYNTLLYDCDENLRKIREMKFLDIVKIFLNCAIEKIAISSLLFTAYVANEGDSMLFKSDQRSLKYLLDLLSQSMKMKSARAKGLSTEELGKGILKLSKNDENKQLLVDLGVLPSLKRLIEKDSVKYKEISLSILWSLAFDGRNRKMINETFAPVLEEVKGYLTRCDTELSQAETVAQDVPVIDSDVVENLGSILVKDRLSTKCSQILNGLSWTLKEGQPRSVEIGSPLQDPIAEGNVADGHIMISYCWTNLDIVMNIYNALKEQGRKLWIDKVNMVENENLMESMAQAVENSVCVIVCVSNAYKESVNCRAEAQYAATKKKPLIPVIVQQSYRPEGWLGICISGLLYYDFMGRHSFEDKFKELSHQLKKILSTKVDTTDHIIPIKTLLEKTALTTDIVTWTTAQVREWFREIGLTKVKWKSNHNGSELSFLKNISENSVDAFVRISEINLGLTDLKDLRIFFDNIRKL